MFKKWFSLNKSSNNTPRSEDQNMAIIPISPKTAAVPAPAPVVGIISGNIVSKTSFGYNTSQNYIYSGIGGTAAISIHNTHISFNDRSGQVIVKLDRDGIVTWENGIQMNQAVESFSSVIRLSAEMQAGITEGTKRRMRDTIFEEMISLAKEKGTLTVEELTYLWQSAKIMDKLKGGRE